MRRPEAQGLIRWRPSRLGLVLAAALCGCATAATPDATPVAAQALEAAAARPPSDLRQAATSGDPVLQLAYALTLEHGLNGLAADEAEATHWRNRALAQQGFRNLPTWQAGVGGEPGRVASLPIHQRPVAPLDVFSARSCAAVLISEPRETPAALARLCGPRAEAWRSLWARARGRPD